MKNLKFYIIAFLLLAGGILIYLFCFGEVDKIIFQIRLGKILNASLVGAALGAAGVMLQNLLRNPLADPYILGTSAGGTLGIVAAGICGLAYFGFGFYIFIIAGAFFASLLVCALAYDKGRSSSVKVILAGVAVNIFLSSLVMLAFFIHKQPYLSILSFMLGTIGERPFFVLISSFILIASGFIFALALSRSADILAFGEDHAQTLGADIKKLRYGVLMCVALLVSGSISLCGAIGFVGFIIPHIARLFVGPKVKNLILASALAGAAFLVNMEVINRFLFYPRQVPIGILCALAGAPFFIWVLLKNRGEYF
jgi:iron complex transport system permease protein